MELGFAQQTTTWFEDNQGTIVASTTVGFTGRLRHVDVQLKLTREYVKARMFKVVYASTRQQLADALTKRVTGPKLREFVDAVLHNT